MSQSMLIFLGMFGYLAFLIVLKWSVAVVLDCVWFSFISVSSLPVCLAHLCVCGLVFRIVAKSNEAPPKLMTVITYHQS